MQTLRCAACRRKLWRYWKIGPGELRRRHKDRVRKIRQLEERDGKVRCVCGRAVGIDRGSRYAMDREGGTCAGIKPVG